MSANKKVVRVLDGRKKQILQAVIRDYVDTAEPVGSRTIAKKYDLGVSPATIRNEMSDLEELGYIKQPHTSAGRIPSNKGYRYYVDCLMDPQADTITAEEQSRIADAFKHQAANIDTLLNESCKLLSQLTNYTAMVIKPKQIIGNLERINLVKVDSEHAVVVMTDSLGKITHKIISIPANITDDELMEMERLLQQKLTGISLAQASNALMKEVAMQVLWHQQMLKQSMNLLQDLVAGDGQNAGNVFVNGALNLLNQPEFRDVDKVRELLSALEVDDIVRQLIGRQTSPLGGGLGRTSVFIGDEIAADGMDSCSVVTTPYYINGQEAGTIGVLGPTRMPYSKVISLVESIGQQVTDKMKENDQF